MISRSHWVTAQNSTIDAARLSCEYTVLVTAIMLSLNQFESDVFSTIVSVF